MFVVEGGQFPRRHFLVCMVAPLQNLRSVLHCLVLILYPLPHVTLQGPKTPHSLQVPTTFDDSGGDLVVAEGQFSSRRHLRVCLAIPLQVLG